MTWPPDIANELPAPRDDEPSSLRQDIADELADHLHSSFAGELHRTPDQPQARQHVLDRFGDPRRVARQLWFDAMKERIMSQRMTIAALVVTAVACLGSTGLSWMLVQQSREANRALLEQAKEAQALNRALLAQNETATTKMLDRLATLAAPAPAAPVKSMDWSATKIRLVKDQPGGAPAAGYDVHVYGNLLDTAKQIDIERKTSTDGVADLGLLRPGKHELRINAPWKESREVQHLTVLPGQDCSLEIVCPGADREQSGVSISFDWPDELRKRKLWTVLRFYQKSREIGDAHWQGPRGWDLFSVFNAAGEVVSQPIDRQSISSDHQLEQFSFVSQRKRAGFSGLFFDDGKLEPWNSQQRAFQRAQPLEKNAHELRPFHFQFLGSPARTEWRLPVGHYVVVAFLLAEHSRLDAIVNNETLDVLGGLINQYNEGPLMTYRYGGLVTPFSEWLDKETDREMGQGSRARNDAIKAAQPQFDVSVGGTNLVHIPVHPVLIENVREFLQFTKGTAAE